MRIVVLNDLTFTQSQLARLRSLGTLVVHPDTTDEQQAVARLHRAEIAVIDGFKLPITRALIEASTNLRLIVLTSTAYHIADLGAASQMGVKIAHIPGYSTEAVAEHAIALLLAVMRAIVPADRAMRARRFEIDPSNNAHRAFLGRELRGKTLGIIGLGAIGNRIAELGAGFDMALVGYNRSPRPVAGLRLTELDELLSVSDVVVLGLAVNPETENFIAERELSLMKPGAVLINTAGWELVDAGALHRALAEGRLGGAGLDVIDPGDKGAPLIALDNVVLSPQSAAWTLEACGNLAEAVVATVEAFARSEPNYIVN